MPRTTLRIAQPCTESWDTMTPAATGRQCAACQKTVVDFTHKTDAEILAALRQAAGETCGRMWADQLGRPLVTPTAAPRWRAWLGAALALGGVLGASRAAAQGQRDSNYAGPRPPASPVGSLAAAGPGLRGNAAAAPETAATGLLTVRGTVLDSATHQGLPGATVLVKGTTIGVSTDANGAFVLPVPASAAPVQLTFSSIGFTRQARTVVSIASQSLVVALAPDGHILMGEVVITDVASPWPWHPRRFFNWSKYWLAKPFRN
jgi:hypothetical protein